jgi:hypothetical protein
MKYVWCIVKNILLKWEWIHTCLTWGEFELVSSSQLLNMYVVYVIYVSLEGSNI